MKVFCISSNHGFNWGKCETGFLDLKMQQWPYTSPPMRLMWITFYGKITFYGLKMQCPYTSPPIRPALNVEPCYMCQPFRMIAPLLLISRLLMQEPKIHLQSVHLVFIWCSFGVHLVLSSKKFEFKDCYNARKMKLNSRFADSTTK